MCLSISPTLKAEESRSCSEACACEASLIMSCRIASMDNLAKSFLRESGKYRPWKLCYGGKASQQRIISTFSL